MIRLVMTLNGEVLDEFALSKTRTTIGRRAHNDIVIDHLGVSGEHAVVVQSAQGLLVQDLRSTNGTYVNGQAVEQRVLRPGDLIGIGRYQLRVADEERSDLTEVTSEGGTNVTSLPDAGASDPDATASVPMRAVVRVLDGTASGREVLLTKERTTFGKPGVLVVAIDRQPEGHVLSQLEGAALAKLNDAPLSRAGVPLRDGDLIDLKGTRLRFSCA